jgi:hypothetical protein
MTEADKALKLLTAAAKPFREAFEYNPGYSDLDRPITITVTLGDWRLLNYALNVTCSSGHGND